MSTWSRFLSRHRFLVAVGLAFLIALSAAAPASALRACWYFYLDNCLDEVHCTFYNAQGDYLGEIHIDYNCQS